MARVTIEDCLEKVDSRFALVHLVVRRVLQLRQGAKPLVESDNKEIVLALREIAAGKISLDNIDLLDKALKEGRAIPESRYDSSALIAESFEEESKRFALPQTESFELPPQEEEEQ